MSTLIVVFALAAIVALAAAAIIITRRTTITVFIRKDPDMATLKERLAALEAARADHDTALANVVTSDQLAVVKSSVDHLTDRVNDIDADIGTDPKALEPVAASALALVEQPAPIALAPFAAPAVAMPAAADTAAVVAPAPTNIPMAG